MNTARPERMKCLSRKKKKDPIYSMCNENVLAARLHSPPYWVRRGETVGTRLCHYLKSLRSKVKAVQLVLSNNRKT